MIKNLHNGEAVHDVSDIIHGSAPDLNIGDIRCMHHSGQVYIYILCMYVCIASNGQHS